MLISFNKIRPSSCTKKSTRAKPSHDTAANAWAASSRTAEASASSITAGTTSFASSSGTYFALKS